MHFSFTWILLLFFVGFPIKGKLILKTYPKAHDLTVVYGIGKSIISCEIESDRPYTLRWYKNGKEIDYNYRPPWPFNYTGGMTLAQWPYMKNYSRGTYECRASNGYDPDVSYKVKFTPIFINKLPPGFPKTLKSPPKEPNYHKQHYGTNITLECDATNNPIIMWTFGYVPFEKLTFPENEGFDYWMSPNKTVLKIYNLKKTYGNIVCFIANDVGIDSAVIQSYLIDSIPVPIPSVPPKIFAMPQNASVQGPEQWIEFVCNATGYPQPYYTWRHDDRIIHSKTYDSKISVVAMKTSKLECFAENDAGKDYAVAYLYVRPVPYKANPPEPDLKHHTPSSFKIELTPFTYELYWHKDIPVTYAILHTRPWYKDMPPWDPYNTTKIAISGPPPWYYSFTNLEPFTWIDTRVGFGNKYGVGNFSDWKHGYSDFGEITEPVRFLKAVAHSEKSFTMYWQNPVKIHGLLKRYNIYWSRIPQWPLEKWAIIYVLGQGWGDTPIRSYTLNWTTSTYITDSAPVIYWKIRLIGFVNEGPMSETKVLRVCPGAPGFVTNVTVKTKDSRTILAYWNATKEPGNGVIGYHVLYYRQDVRAFEPEWYVVNVTGESVHEITITDLRPNRPYIVSVYPVSHAMRGVRSTIVNTTTLPDVPSAPPQNVHGKATSSQTIEVEFEPPPEDHHNAPILHYEILYTRTLNREPLNVEVDKETRKYLLQGLAKYTKYIVWVVAINTEGRSPPSPKFEIYTAEQVPDGAPKEVRAQAVNDATISIIWLPPDVFHQNGRLIGFNIYYSTKRWEKTMQVLGAQSRSCILYGYISADNEYFIQVSAFTSLGEGPRSNKLVVHTPPLLPASPAYINTSIDLTYNRVMLVWRSPPLKIMRFKLQWGKSLRKFDMLRDITERYYPPIVRTAHIEDLDPGVFYCFKVLAEIDDEGGVTASDVVWYETSPNVPSGPPQFFEAVPQSSSSIKLRWEEPLPWKRNGDIIAYIVFHKAIDEMTWNIERYEVKNDEDTIVYLVVDLKADTKYQFKLKAATIVGSGVETNVLEAKTIKEVLPIIANLKVLEIETETAYLQWGQLINGEKFKAAIPQFYITYKCSKTYYNESGHLIMYDVTKTEVSLSRQYYLDKLKPGTLCKVAVQVNLENIGLGDPVNITFTTVSKVPDKVVPPMLVSEAQNEGKVIPLQITPSLEINGPVDYYQLFVVDIGDETAIPPELNPEKFGVGQSTRTRRSTKDWPFHVAGHFKSADLPVAYNVGDGHRDIYYDNKELAYKHHYVMFLRASVKQPDDNHVRKNSPPLGPIQFLYQRANNNPASLDGSGSGGGGGGMVPIIAGAVGGLLGIIIAVVLIIFVCKRKSPDLNEEEALLRKKSKKSRNSSDPTELHRKQRNTPGLMSHPPIPVETLADHVESLKANDRVKFQQEFESIDPGEKPPAEASVHEINKPKNRFPNVLAYDETRVKLDFDGTLCSDYINANYIDGYCREKAYIATQGPMQNTINDFWRLCWEQNVRTIVMMTKLTERGKNKCEQYWPSKGIETFDKIKVEFRHAKLTCDYCVREFEVSSTVSSEKHIIRQFQYLQWPDPGVPANPCPVLAFIRRIRDYNPPGSGPILVHCTSGVGRTACFIAIDAMIERVKQDSMIDIYGYVNMLRLQRNYMVQTDQQYLFIYETLVEHILYGNTEIASVELTSHFKKLQELRGDGIETMLEAEFRAISTSASSIVQPSHTSVATASVNESKNRSLTIVPFDSNRVTLQPLRSQEGSDYINASFVDGFSTKNAFIATQAPMENTVSDFWRMIVEHNCSTIVMLCNLEQNGKEQSFQYWPGKKSMRHHYYVIDPVQEKRFANFIVREFKITDARDSSTREVRQYHYTTWLSSRVPSSSEGIIELVGQVQKSHDKDFSLGGPIVVHGRTGSGRTGVFIGLCIALQSLRADCIVDIHQIVKGLRHQRPYMVQTLEQYEYCYKVACDFLKNFDFVV